MIKQFLTVEECLALLPVRVSEREFRRQVREMGLCYKRGHQISLSQQQLATYIETLKCPISHSTDAAKSTTSEGRSKSPAKKRGSEFERAQAMLD